MEHGQEDKFICKFTGFVKFPTNDDVNHCVAIKENGEEIHIDPFVGCAWKYESKEHLLDNWFDVEGHWFSDERFEPQPVFLVREGKIKPYKSNSPSQEEK